MKMITRVTTFLLCTVLLLSVTVFPASAQSLTTGGIDTYKEYLLGLGFPLSYAEKLAVLHTLHPNWDFTPLMVTELNSKYTWDYVLRMEAADESTPARSLIPSGGVYSPYRHATDTALYDTGWYRASQSAVAYMLDPRNFLNEKDIFQFENIMLTSTITTAQVEAALTGTFMAGAYLENGKTYAEYFHEVGYELGINPLHLASRARQEQGIGGTAAQISGAGGDKLWYYYSNNIQNEGASFVNAPSSGYTESSLLQYNGYYNFYNINASGTGRFAVLLASLARAKTGTPTKADEWGSPEWNTRWKSIYGGAYELYTKYISNYQNTLYLQKWNVDARSKSASGGSRNFWGQYMQNIGGALGEGRNTYVALAQSDSLDCEYSFLIPVYSGMPDVNSDPAAGACGIFALSDAKYTFKSQLTAPATAVAVSSPLSAAHAAVSVGGTLSLAGWSVHTYGLGGYEYSIDGGEWVAASASYSSAAAAANPNYLNCTSAGAVNSFSVNIATGGLSAGSHTVALRGVAAFGAAAEYIDCSYYLIAEITFELKTVENVNVTINNADGTYVSASALPSGSVYSLPNAPAVNDTFFAGWIVQSATAKLFLPAGADLKLTGGVTLTPLYVELETLGGAALKINETTSLRYSTVISHGDYASLILAAGAANVELGQIICADSERGNLNLDPITLTSSGVPYRLVVSSAWSGDDGEYYRFSGDTDAITSAGYQKSYCAVGYIMIKYTNSATAYIIAPFDAKSATRSAKAVAAAALADTGYRYSEEEMAVLRRIAGG